MTAGPPILTRHPESRFHPASQAQIMRWIALGCAGVFIALAACVHLGLLDTFDSAIREWARPGDVWGTTQMRADYFVEGLRPSVLAVILAAFTVAFCVKRRSLRPGIFAASFWLATVGLIVATKTAVGRPDPHGLLPSAYEGSFPSGHMASVVVCLGLVVLVARPAADRWVWLFPVLGGGLMGTSLLLQAAHWSTDIIGGGLLATSSLAVAAASSRSRWSHGQLRNDQGGKR
jgi:membrane-associated phospholipid phosphatase